MKKPVFAESYIWSAPINYYFQEPRVKDNIISLERTTHLFCNYKIVCTKIEKVKIYIVDKKIYLDTGSFRSTPDRIWTCGLRIRSPLLYPAELPGQMPFSRRQTSNTKRIEASSRFLVCTLYVRKSIRNLSIHWI